MTTQEEATPHKLIFELVQHHEGYIAFSISYYLEYNQWTAEGIGWMSNGAPAYYLRSLKLNNFPAARHYEERANLVEQDLSVKFQNQVLEDFTLVKVRHHFEKSPKGRKKSA